jgi:hypothetical protein
VQFLSPAVELCSLNFDVFLDDEVSVELRYDRVVNFSALVGCEMQAGENVLVLNSVAIRNRSNRHFQADHFAASKLKRSGQGMSIFLYQRFSKELIVSVTTAMLRHHSLLTVKY